MSAEIPIKSGQKSRYFRTPDFARVSNRKVAVTFRACLLLLGRKNGNGGKGLASNSRYYPAHHGGGFSPPPWVQSNVLLS